MKTLENIPSNCGMQDIDIFTCAYAMPYDLG